MDNLKWRYPSRIVAIVDLILSSIALLVMVLAVILGTAATSIILEHKNDPDVKDSQDHISAVIWVMWIVLVLVSVIVAVDIWAAVMLLKATSEGTDHVNAAKRARIWRNVNIVFFILSLLNLFATTSYFTVIGSLIFRGILLYIVFNFIKELDQAIATPGFSNLDNVVVNK